MAVTGPTPPVPPTPPVVPKVTLGGQGAETSASQEAAAPGNRQGDAGAGRPARSASPASAAAEGEVQSSDAAAEEQARNSVAQGNGTLSKTTTTTAAERAAAAREAAQKMRGDSRDGSGDSGNDAGTAARQEAPAPLMLPTDSSSGQASGGEAQSNAAAAAAQPADDPSPSMGGHGGLFWGLGISLLLAGAFLFARMSRKRSGKSRRGRKTPDMNLTGQTADEVLRALEAQQAAQLKNAQEKAAQRVPMPSAETAAADHYRAQAERPPQAGAPPKPAQAPKPLRRKPEDKDAPRFEVRI